MCFSVFVDLSSSHAEQDPRSVGHREAAEPQSHPGLLQLLLGQTRQFSSILVALKQAISLPESSGVLQSHRRQSS